MATLLRILHEVPKSLDLSEQLALVLDHLEAGVMLPVDEVSETLVLSDQGGLAARTRRPRVLGGCVLVDLGLVHLADGVEVVHV